MLKHISVWCLEFSVYRYAWCVCWYARTLINMRIIPGGTSNLASALSEILMRKRLGCVFWHFIIKLSIDIGIIILCLMGVCMFPAKFSRGDHPGLRITMILYNYIHSKRLLSLINKLFLNRYPKTHPPNHTELELHLNVPTWAISKNYNFRGCVIVRRSRLRSLLKVMAVGVGVWRRLRLNT